MKFLKNYLILSKFYLNSHTPNFAIYHTWLILRKKVREHSDSVDEAQSLGVETDSHFQLPRIEDIIDIFSVSRKQLGRIGGCCKSLPQKTSAIKVQRDAFLLPFAEIIVNGARDAQIGASEPVTLKYPLTVNHHKLAVFIFHLMAQRFFIDLKQKTGA